MLSKTDKNCGFSLMELMVALAIIAILATIAIPSYQSHVQNAKRSDGIGALLALATLQEKYYLNAGAYTDDMTLLGYAADPALSPESFYELDATLTNGGQLYTLTATRQGSHVSDTICGDLVLTSIGVKTAVNHSSSDPLKDCWK